MKVGVLSSARNFLSILVTLPRNLTSLACWIVCPVRVSENFGFKSSAEDRLRGLSQAL
jgi:hypothetical protein